MRVSSVGLVLLNQLSLGIMLICCHTAQAQVTSDGTTNTIVNPSAETQRGEVREGSNFLINWWESK